MYFCLFTFFFIYSFISLASYLVIYLLVYLWSVLHHTQDYFTHTAATSMMVEVNRAQTWGWWGWGGGPTTIRQLQRTFKRTTGEEAGVT